MNATPPIHEGKEVRRVAEAIRRSGAFALDLEFVSVSRYQPDLALVQVAWGDPAAPEVAAIDPLAVDPAPIAELIASPEILTILHAAQGDLAILASLYGVRARGIADTQLAAAMVGLGEQVGYAALVRGLLGESLDKAMQFTDWLARPLSPEQLAYALDDVRYLARVWGRLEEQLRARGRLSWVNAEADRLAEDAVWRPEPEEAYLRIGSWMTLDARQLGALRKLAAWRERRAAEANRPPSWLAKDRYLLDVARRLPASRDILKTVPGANAGWLDRHGKAVVALVSEGRAEPIPPPPRPRLSVAERKRAGKLAAHLEERCKAAAIAVRMVVQKGDAEQLLDWWLRQGDGPEPAIPLLQGWRRELAGEAALAWLAAREPRREQLALTL